MTLLANSKAYDAAFLERQILNSDPTIVESVDFAQETDDLIEKTMSCDLGEAIGWMRFWMSESLTASKNEYNRSLRIQFIAAYRMYIYLMKGGN